MSTCVTVKKKGHRLLILFFKKFFLLKLKTCLQGSSASDDEGFDFALDQDGAPEPLVFLLGWAGCNDRYSSLLETLESH